MSVDNESVSDGGAGVGGCVGRIVGAGVGTGVGDGVGDGDGGNRHWSAGPKIFPPTTQHTRSP